jgi:hypothetical protein
MEYVIRFLAGGLVVSLFAVAGDVLRPKSFAGLFGAAPSVALATLTLAFWKHGGRYVATEGRSMIIGAIALAVYSFLVCQLLMRVRSSAHGDSCGNYRMACYCRRHQTGGVGVGDDCPRQGLGTQTRRLV